MKSLAFALILLCFFTHSGFGFDLGKVRVGGTKAMSIAKDASLPGKGISGKEQEYAEALNGKFQEAGINAWIVEINGHAAVAFVDGTRTYVMDNLSWRPKWMEVSVPKPVVPTGPFEDASLKAEPIPKGELPAEPQPEMPQH